MNFIRIVLMVVIFSCGENPQNTSTFPIPSEVNPSLGLTSTLNQASVELSSSVSLEGVSGIASVPRVGSNASELAGAQIYAWDATGNQRLLELTKDPKRGSFSEIYFTKNHILFSVDRNSPDQITRGIERCSVVILTTATGVLNCLANIQISDRIREWSKKPIVSANASGDIIVFNAFTSVGGGGYEDLLRLDMSSGVPKLTNLNDAEGAYEEDYAINDDGDVVFKTAGERAGRQLRSAALVGAIQPIANADNAEWTKCLTNGVETNRNNFYSTSGSGTVDSNGIYRYSRNSNGTFAAERLTVNSSEVNEFDCQIVYRGSNQLFFIGQLNGGVAVLSFEDKPEGTPDVWSMRTMEQMNSAELVAGDLSNLYIVGEDELGSGTLRSMSFADGSQTTLVTHYQYVFTDLKGPIGGHLLFVGERMSDSAYVQVRVNIADQSIVPVKVQLPAVRQLIPLN